MNCRSFLRRALVAALPFVALATASSGAHAAFRQYLSASGNDANPCTLVAPCRLLPAALALVDPGGEIWMLDSANFNNTPISVTKSVTILAIPGHLGSVVGIAGGPALTINAPGIEVTLQNLNILNLVTSPGPVGVLVSNAAQVSIINSNIFGFAGGAGISVNPGLNAPKVNVINSIVRNNATGIVATGGRITVSKTHVVANSGSGIVSAAAGTAVAAVHVSDSVSSSNGGNGFMVTGSASGGSSQMYVTRSVATENTSNGFLTDGGAAGTMVVNDSMATRNTGVGFNNTAGTFFSRGNNTVSGNGGGASSGVITGLSGL